MCQQCKAAAKHGSGKYMRAALHPPLTAKTKQFVELQGESYCTYCGIYAPSNHTVRELFAAWVAAGGGKMPAKYREWRRSMSFGEVDHIVAICAGGTDELTNLTWACHKCNQAKRTSSATTFQPKKVKR